MILFFPSSTYLARPASSRLLAYLFQFTAQQIATMSGASRIEYSEKYADEENEYR